MKSGADMNGELAVVVGATGAMGSAMTERLVAHGLGVVAVARSAAALAELAATSESIVPCVADIGHNSAVDIIGAALNTALNAPVRIAVFAAGLPVRGSVDTIDPDLFATGANIKIGGMVRLVNAVRPRLVRGSRIVAVAGSLGLEPSSSEAGPGAINAGLFNVMRQYSLLYGPKGITTHTVSPGPADTPRLRRIVEAVAAERGVAFDEVWAEYESRNSLGRLPTVQEIAWAMDMLLSPQADLMHGSVLKMDGGASRGIG
ncbi:MAG: Diacetyl reductase [Actinomycetota bacterium]|jgi:NAD(P)-dependent dehydrogenase (short-subunit alcohol dehydrogenase family)